jgi:hypothetical protein
MSANNRQQSNLEICIVYVNKDSRFKEELTKHLSVLERDGSISLIFLNLDGSTKTNSENYTPYNHQHIKISPSHLILFLLSPDFLNFEDFDRYMNEALRATEKYNCRVIPIPLKNCLWKKTSIGHLSPLPANSVPIDDNKVWGNQNNAFHSISESIDNIVKDIKREEEEYQRKILQYQGIVIQQYKQNGSLGEQAYQILNQYRINLEIKDKDAKKIEAAVKKQFRSEKVNRENTPTYQHSVTRGEIEYLSESTMGWGCLIVLFIFILPILANRSPQPNTALTEVPQKPDVSQPIPAEAFDKAQNFPVDFINNLNNRQYQKVWDMLSSQTQEASMPYINTIKKWEKIKQGEPKVYKEVFRGETIVKLYVEWKYCEADKLYYDSGFWWLTWNERNQKWILDKMENSPQFRSMCSSKN